MSTKSFYELFLLQLYKCYSMSTSQVIIKKNLSFLVGGIFCRLFLQSCLLFSVPFPTTVLSMTYNAIRSYSICWNITEYIWNIFLPPSGRSQEKQAEDIRAIEFSTFWSSYRATITLLQLCTLPVAKPSLAFSPLFIYLSPVPSPDSSV